MIGYDLDGVLCKGPFIPGDPYRVLTEEERNARRDELLNHFRTAPALFIAPEPDFIVITGKPDLPDFREATEMWLENHYQRKVKVFLHSGLDRSKDGIAEHKYKIIVQHGVTEFTDDSPHTVKYLRKRLNNVKINLYEGNK